MLLSYDIGGLVGRRFDVLSLETLEGSDVNVRHQGVQLVHGVLIFVSQSG